LYLYSPYEPFGLYRASVLLQKCTLPLPLQLINYYSGDEITVGEGVRCARIEKACRILLEKTAGKALEDPGIDGRMLLKWILETNNERAWIGLNLFELGACGGHM
jgi:hypothetical protein